MKRDSRAPLIVAIVLLLLPLLYVGSYLALVVPGQLNLGKMFFTGVGNYRIGGGYSHIIFWPLEQIDRKVRPGAWEIDLPHYGDFGPTKLETPDLDP